MPKKKYAKLAETLGWGESFEPQADGVFLQPEEAEKVDTALTQAAADSAALQEAQETQKNQQTTITQLTDQLNTANGTIATQKTKIEELGKEPSGSGTEITTTEDEQSGGKRNKKITLNSPEHPLNVMAARKVASAAKK